MTSRAKPASCDGCQCRSHGTDFSMVEGTGANGVLVVAEASGEAEQRDLLPLRPHAPAGGVYTRVLRRMGLDRAQFSTTNVLRCRPRNNWLENSPWEYAAIRHCLPNLEATLAERQPRAIVALGGIATRELTGQAGPSQGVSHLAGYVLPCIYDPEAADPIPVIPNFHPSYLRRGKASHHGVFARIIQRALNISIDRDRWWDWDIDPESEACHERLAYQPRPSLDDALAFGHRVRESHGAVVSYDIETSESASLDEDARDGFADTQIRLIQFSVEGLGSIAFPWEGGFRAAGAEILRGDNPKCGHNVWLFDDKVLKAAGAREGLDLSPRGVVHDTLQMFHHWQPDLPAHLQFAASYVSFPFPWKHLAGGHIEFYGCCDVDATLRLYKFLRARLEAEGLWGDGTVGYVGQVAEVRPVLAAMEDRGLPVDDTERLKLDGEFERAQTALGAELAALAPVDARRVHPKEGYKGVPPEVKAWVNAHDPMLPVTENNWIVSIGSARFREPGLDGERYAYHRREFPVPTVDAATGEPVVVPTPRWCRVYDFNPNSSQQLLAYMKAKGHKPPKDKHREDADGNATDTTAAKELQRLAHRTGDTFYLKVIEYRGLTKMRGTYVDGFAPGPDRRVHTTFTFDTGIGQLSSRNPNIQNFPKLKPTPALAKAMRRMVAADLGNVITEWDYKSCHVITLGFLAEDLNYMRLGRLDIHSFVAGHFLGSWDARQAFEKSDDELREMFRWFKSDPERKRVRDDQAKHAILGIGNGLKSKGLYERYMENFANQKVAGTFLGIARELFPKVFAWQDRIQRQAHDARKLVTEYGHIRRFYEVFRWDARKGDWAHGDQAEQAISFWLSNIAFGHIREALKELDRRGLAARYGLFNNVHDSFLFHFPAGMLDQHVAEVRPVLEAPSRVLRNATAPDGLAIGVEASAGPNWADMEEIRLPIVHPPTSTPAPVLA